MYAYHWTDWLGVFSLSIQSKIEKEIRPVFKEELDYFEFRKYGWDYPDTPTLEPLLWAEGVRRYVYNLNGATAESECVAEAIGGGFYTKPIIKPHKEDLKLTPIDLDRLWTENEQIMLGLEKTAIDFIRKQYAVYSKKGMAFVVAFSGGKDSLVVLDLVSRALSPDKFFVVFSNTGMELSVTLDAVEKAKKHWSSLRFYEAKSHMSPSESWDEFGPPAQKIRWCCNVHKSVPTILLLRELTGRDDVKAVVFDGVRASESAARAGRNEVTEGTKNINQVNCSPIFKWNAAEVYLYLLHRKILFNDAYRFGFTRVGCTICPMSSGWKDSLSNQLFSNEIAPLLHKVEDYAVDAGIQLEERKSYIEIGGWRARMGGKALKNGGNRVAETIEENTIKFEFKISKQDWLDAAVILGPIVEYNGDEWTQLIGHKVVHFSVRCDRTGIHSVTYSLGDVIKDRFIVSYLRAIARKVAYCVGCKTCCAQCPTGAFTIQADGKIFIRQERCTHCCNCVTFIDKSCLVAKSISVTGGNKVETVKGINRYQTFGLRQNFLDHFFEHKVDCFTMGLLGTRQYEGLKAWLFDANILAVDTSQSNKTITTVLFESLESLGPNDTLTWAVIWVNLAYGSNICRWYVLNVHTGETFDKNELVAHFGDSASEKTRSNAFAALLNTFKESPIGTELKQGVESGKVKSATRYTREGWRTPEAAAILYALYKWAETTGRYAFTLTNMLATRDNPEATAVDPAAIFGIEPERFKEILRELSVHYSEFIRSNFAADLDNISLIEGLTALDVLSKLMPERAQEV